MDGNRMKPPNKAKPPPPRISTRTAEVFSSSDDDMHSVVISVLPDRHIAHLRNRAPEALVSRFVPAGSRIEGIADTAHIDRGFAAALVVFHNSRDLRVRQCGKPLAGICRRGERNEASLVFHKETGYDCSIRKPDMIVLEI